MPCVSTSNGGACAVVRAATAPREARSSVHGRGVVEQLAADERPRVVLAQVEVAQFRELVAEGLVHLLADTGDRRRTPLEPGGGLLGEVGQPLRVRR